MRRLRSRRWQRSQTKGSRMQIDCHAAGRRLDSKIVKPWTALTCPTARKTDSKTKGKLVCDCAGNLFLGYNGAKWARWLWTKSLVAKCGWHTWSLIGPTLRSDMLCFLGVTRTGHTDPIDLNTRSIFGGEWSGISAWFQFRRKQKPIYIHRDYFPPDWTKTDLENTEGIFENTLFDHGTAKSRIERYLGF